MKKIKLIIGLGNPDLKYENTYHNAGHLFVDFLENTPKNPVSNPPTGGQYLKSNCYMNKSGEFAKKAVKEYNIKPEELLVAQDDSDIELGKFKLSFGRNSAGHRGVQNIIDQLKTNKFWRLRIGIRPPRNKDKADELVLKKITPARLATLKEVFKESSSRLAQL